MIMKFGFLWWFHINTGTYSEKFQKNLTLKKKTPPHSFSKANCGCFQMNLVKLSRQIFIYSKSTKETLEKGEKYDQS